MHRNAAYDALVAAKNAAGKYRYAAKKKSQYSRKAKARITPLLVCYAFIARRRGKQDVNC